MSGPRRSRPEGGRSYSSSFHRFVGDFGDVVLLESRAYRILVCRIRRAGNVNNVEDHAELLSIEPEGSRLPAAFLSGGDVVCSGQPFSVDLEREVNFRRQGVQGESDADGVLVGDVGFCVFGSHGRIIPYRYR